MVQMPIQESGPKIISEGESGRRFSATRNGSVSGYRFKYNKYERKHNKKASPKPLARGLRDYVIYLILHFQHFTKDLQE